jgi:glycosyltransferase involved in cell wall biosynthesis
MRRRTLRSSGKKMNGADNSDVSVVILTRNSAQTIEGCLQALVDESPLEIIAVDMLSVDGTIDILKRYGARVLADPIGSIGYSRRLGSESAHGDFVMFVSSDIEVTKGCISQLRQDLKKYKLAGVHASLVAMEKVSYWQRAEDECLRVELGGAGPKEFIPLTAALFRRKVLLEHPFDPSFREAAEDADLNVRLRKGMYRVGVSKAIAYHMYKREFSEFARRRFLWGVGDARILLKYGRVRFRSLAAPLGWALFASVEAILFRHFSLVPAYVVEQLAKFSGIVSGLSMPTRSS